MTLGDAYTAMLDALAPLADEIPGLQICGWWTQNPSPPSIDIMPADPFQTGAGFGVGEKTVRWLVRARVSSVDTKAATELLLRLLDANDPASVEAALANADPEAVVSNEGTVSGFTRFADDPNENLVGATWTVEQFV